MFKIYFGGRPLSSSRVPKIKRVINKLGDDVDPQPQPRPLLTIQFSVRPTACSPLAYLKPRDSAVGGDGRNVTMPPSSAPSRFTQQ